METIPDVIEHPTDADVLRVMTRAVFQTGLSWAQIAKHWDGYERAFEQFDLALVSSYGESDVERILGEPGVLRSARKVKATIANAVALRDLVREYGSFHGYATTFSNYGAIARDLKKRFSFMGDMNAWYVLFRVREPVPRFETWVQTIPGEHPRMREMVERARAMDRSAEQDDSPAAAG